MYRTTRRSRLTATLAAVLVLGAAACGGSGDSGSDDGDGTGGRAGDQAQAEPGAFPVTIEHRFGSTTIEEEPQRIMTVGLSDQDAVLALGKVPVGTTEWLGLHDAAIGPWAQEEIGDAELPTMLEDPGTGPQLEEITLLNPDLILALYAGLTQEQYESLSQIAPVVAAPEEYVDWGIPWQEQTLITGQALGRPEAARDLVTEVEDRLATEMEAHAEFQEATGIVASPYEGYWVFGPQDPRSRLLTNLGLTTPEGLDEAVGGEFGANISRERTDLLDQSVAVWFVPDPETAVDELHGDPLYGGLAVAQEGREIIVGETTDYGAAFTFGTVLSLPYVIDRLVPQLEAAVDGDPATAVAQPAD
ncbi:iron-siderophore ABC transporter substrate-binding protein [Streptomyces litchfieldiae]|uniref:Iron-siderophore ABC transporter substrate-binding protein n=1 Tax=Streptomyces litchfieldiae TaxID=3075543 RepID=A0ABU2MT19_9ACTN|nr:iron-siderophore ABC transporter substrate-binding protein [Streptomyces sp. DSM 44938]MDT0344611.1 iron-siderophore ABC transporter substrate-binding protein [Streptomyces sp. DSM 44938]